jgi:hypothetical protein
LLYEFFHFYAFTFQRDRYAIDIRRLSPREADVSSAESSRSGFDQWGPFCPREELLEEIKKQVQEPFDLDHTSTMNRLDSSMFLVGDPFCRTYNPAKVKADSAEAEAYDRAFKTAFL